MRMRSDVYRAAVDGNRDVLQMVEHLDNELTPNQNTVLHVHIRGGMPKKDCVLYMVERCPSLIWMMNNEDETPLHMAAKEGLTEIVRALVEQVRPLHHGDADLESGRRQAVKQMLGMRNKEEGTALHEAVRYGQLDVAKLLIGNDPESGCCRNKAGETPLYMAVRRGFHGLVDEILNICQSPASCDGPNGLTALHLAVTCSDDGGKMGTKIMGKFPELATELDDQNGWTPLHCAAYFGKASQAEALLRQNEEAAYTRDSSGKTPIHIAATRNHVQARSRKAMEFILNQDWGRNILINGKDEGGNTPLHKFARSPCFVVTLLCCNPRVLDKMAVNNEGMTAADILLSNTGAPVLKVLFGCVLNKTAPALPSISINDRGGGRRGAAAAGGGVVDHHGGAGKDSVKKSQIKKASKIHLIVAALIATVTYAAGFTLPGGFKADVGSHRGMAVLAKKATFITFYLTDGIAMLFSTIAVVSHFLMTLQDDKEQLYRMFKLASYSTLVAMGAMVASFVMAACAVLVSGSGILVVLAAVIMLSFFSLFYIVYPLLAKWVENIFPDRKGK